MYVTNFTCILLETQVCAAVSVPVSSNFGCRNYLSACYFCYIFGSFLRHLWQYAEFEDRYSKKPVSVTKKDISDHIYQLIYSSTSVPGAKMSQQIFILLAAWLLAHFCSGVPI